MVTGYALPDFRPVVVRVTSFSEAAASIRSWVKEAINFLYRGHPRPNFIGYDPRTVELRLGRFVVLGPVQPRWSRFSQRPSFIYCRAPAPASEAAPWTGSRARRR